MPAFEIVSDFGMTGDQPCSSRFEVLPLLRDEVGFQLSAIFISLEFSSPESSIIKIPCPHYFGVFPAR